MPKHVLIVDDEASIVTLMTHTLEKEGFITDISYSGTDAAEKAARNTYDFIILDIMLPGMDGMEVCRLLRENKIETPILMLTAKDDEHDKIKGLDIGADDYLTKPFSPHEVVSRINAIFRRMEKFDQKSSPKLSVGELTIYPDRYTAFTGEEELRFTRKEFELLHYLAVHKDDVLSREHLLYAVWDYSFSGDTRIVDVHVGRLREKIEQDTKYPNYIKTVRGLGYKMEEPI